MNIGEFIERHSEPVTLASLTCGCLPILQGHHAQGDGAECEHHGAQAIDAAVRTTFVKVREI